MSSITYLSLSIIIVMPMLVSLVEGADGLVNRLFGR